MEYNKKEKQYPSLEKYVPAVKPAELNAKPSVLELIATSNTNLKDCTQKTYGADSCSCGNCACHRHFITALLSPAGIAAVATIFATQSAD